MLAFAFYVVAGLPSRAEVRRLATRNPDRTSVMRQREEEAADAGRPARSQQSWTPLSRMSKHLIHAVLASEDQKFFGHEGVDWDAVEKAIEEDRKRLRFARGGSTITQQLAKNLYFTTHRSLVRKLREVIVARWLEEELGKKRILELYLNVIEWGDGIYGAQAAALALLRQARERAGRGGGGGTGGHDPEPAADPPAPGPEAARPRAAEGAVAHAERGVPEARDGRARRGAAAGGRGRRRAGSRSRAAGGRGGATEVRVRSAADGRANRAGRSSPRRCSPA